MGWTTRITVAAAVAVVAAGIVWGLRPQPVRVDAVAVARGALVAEVTSEGRTHMRARHEVDAPIAGLQSRIRFEVGDPVDRGTVVARAASRREQAEADLARGADLVEKGIAPTTRREQDALAALVAERDLDVTSRGHIFLRPDRRSYWAGELIDDFSDTVRVLGRAIWPGGSLE